MALPFCETRVLLHVSMCASTLEPTYSHREPLAVTFVLSRCRLPSTQ